MPMYFLRLRWLLDHLGGSTAWWWQQLCAKATFRAEQFATQKKLQLWFDFEIRCVFLLISTTGQLCALQVALQSYLEISCRMCCRGWKWHFVAGIGVDTNLHSIPREKRMLGSQKRWAENGTKDRRGPNFLLEISVRSLVICQFYSHSIDQIACNQRNILRK